jgi:PhoH-like ATPase
VQQKFALELLLNDAAQLVTLVGGAGTGKTLLALASGLRRSWTSASTPSVRVAADHAAGPRHRLLARHQGREARALDAPIYDNLKLLTDSFYDDEDKLQTCSTARFSRWKP